MPPEYSWLALHLRSPPAFSTVLKHLQVITLMVFLVSPRVLAHAGTDMPNKNSSQVIGINGGEDTLAHWPTASDMMTVDEASCEVLKYLDKVWSSLSSSGSHLLCFSCY